MRYLDIALPHVDRGYHQFPCREVSKTPACPHGVHEATLDERRHLHWGDRLPFANAAIAPGASGATVLDIDAKHGASPGDVIGELELDTTQLVRVDTGIAPEPSSEFPASLAGERGAHLYYRGAVESTTRTRMPGVEIRSIGLYVMTPGSRHPSGVPYEGRLPHVQRLPEPPDSVLELREHAAATYGTGELIVPADDEPIEQGGRHQALLGWAMESLYKQGITGQAALVAMLAENHRRVRPPLTGDQVCRLWRWADRSKVARGERLVASARRDGLAGLWGGHGLRGGR